MTRKLYRDPDNAPLFGVCTGIAQYMGVEPWIIRLVCVLGVFFVGWFIVPAYIIAIFVIDRKPEDYEEYTTGDDKFRRSRKRRRSIHSTGDDTPREEFEDYVPAESFNWRMRVVRREILKMEKKLERMETYITSGRYELFKEFENISKP